MSRRGRNELRIKHVREKRLQNYSKIVLIGMMQTTLSQQYYFKILTKLIITFKNFSKEK